MDETLAHVNRILLKGLAIECPFGSPADDCPARDLRVMPVDKRMIAVDSMGSEEVEEIVVRHKKCLKRRKQR